MKLIANYVVRKLIAKFDTFLEKIWQNPPIQKKKKNVKFNIGQNTLNLASFLKSNKKMTKFTKFSN